MLQGSGRRVLWYLYLVGEDAGLGGGPPPAERGWLAGGVRSRGDAHPGEHGVEGREVYDARAGHVVGDAELLLLRVDREAQGALAHRPVVAIGRHHAVVGLLGLLARDAHELLERRDAALAVGFGELQRTN